MADAVTVRTRNLIKNPLLKRRQFVVDVVHPGKAPVSKEDLTKQICSMFSGVDSKCVVLFHFKVAFGGGRSTGFGLIYDNLDALKKYEPRWRQIRYGFADARTRSRKAYKELKKKIRTTWGTGRRARLRKERRAAE